MRRFVLIYLLIFSIGKLNAATFTVTSKADAGAGTLREAITLANANGTTNTDFIYFNLPGSTINDVTIQLQSELPILTSNIEIDGTTQGFAVLGNPFIKVKLLRIGADYFNGLRLDNASDIKIFGLSFSNFLSLPGVTTDEDKKAGIYLYNANNIKIGDVNKPNCFYNNSYGILSPFSSVQPRPYVSNTKISANIIGLNEDGLTIGPNESGIDISFFKNGIIGGDTPVEGNLIASNTLKQIALSGAEEDVKIAGNTIGLDFTKNRNLISNKAEGIYMVAQNCTPRILNNIICAQNIGIYLENVNGFTIAGNRIGTSITGNENFKNTEGVHIKNVRIKGTIGGTGSDVENKIAYNQTGVFMEFTYPISILKNSFYCNVNAVSFKDIPAGKTITPSKINTITANTVSGTYLPNSTIELFYTDSCPDCQGKTWFATINTDATGEWSYTGPITGKITSMGTNQDGATSSFSKPLLDEGKVDIQNVVCGSTNGSITGIIVYDASIFEWINVATGLVVGTSAKLENVGAGTYYLRAGQNGACDVKSAPYTITSSNGINEQNKDIKPGHCGGTDGYIKNISIVGNGSRVWYLENGGPVGTNPDLINVPPGRYYFESGQGTCKITSPIYTIANVVITYKAKTTVMVSSTCGASNGSVSITSYETTRPDSFKWYDSQGNQISTDENLKDVSPGNYTLVAFGNNGCTNEVGKFEVTEAPLPSINYANLQKLLSCDGKTVSALGIVINGATEPYSYRWLDENHITVATSLELKGVPAGNYSLQVMDKNNCIVDGEVLDFTQLEDSALKIPNSFTPNGDGINDTWRIKGVVNYPYADLAIYSRNGLLVFSAKGYAREFDGTYKGKPLPTGVYYYVIDLKSECGILTGSLTIIK